MLYLKLKMLCLKYKNASNVISKIKNDKSNSRRSIQYLEKYLEVF